MVTECRPLRESGGLPPRRSELIQAGAASPVVKESLTTQSDWGGSINVPLARDRMLEYFEREQLPGDVRSTLQAALTGDLHYQHLLFTAMLDTWPKLQKSVEEIARKVSCAPWKVVPYTERGEKPDAKAQKTAKEIEALIWGMKPKVERMENGLEDTIKAIVRGYYYGHAVCEIRWEMKDGWRPRATKTIPARYYGYPYDGATAEDPEDRLMFDPTGMQGSRAFEDFAENRFLIAIHTGHAGHPAMAAPLRALAGYWLAAVYGLKWFMNFTQLYGIPWRHAEVGDTKDENAVKSALASIGSNGYIVTKPGTKINVMAPGSTSAASLPQRELIALADQQCDQFILGQTLTSGVSADGGSRALGEVHQGTLDGVVDGVADFVGSVLTHQLIPAIVDVNYGDSLGDELPEMWAKREEVKDEKALAERDEKIGITSGKVPVSKAWFYERHGIPTPADGDDLLIEEMEEPELEEPELGPDGKPLPAEPPSQKVNPRGKLPGMKKAVEAADAGEWVNFDSSLGIPRREMPQIASSNRAAMVGFLKARGIESKRDEIMAKHLLPTQAEYSPAKVKSAREFTGGNRAILVSEDGHVVDGHHQWKAALDAGERVEIIRLMAPISRVLMMAHRMPSTTVAAVDASEVARLEELMKQAEAAIDADGLVNEDAIASMLAAAWVSGAKPDKIEAGGWRNIDGNNVYIENPSSSSPGDKSADSYRDSKRAAGDSKKGGNLESTATKKNSSSEPAMKRNTDRPTEYKHPEKPLTVNDRSMRINGYHAADVADLENPKPVTDPDQLAALKKAGKNPEDFRSVGKASMAPDTLEWAQKHAKLAKENAAANTSDREELMRENVPGLKEFQDSLNEQDTYRQKFGRMMEDEGNDGARPPSQPKTNPDELAKKYPRAAAYQQAESYEMASNYQKSAAGKKALKRIMMGDDIEDVIKEMKGWINEVNID